jgi:hypothetical protein
LPQGVTLGAISAQPEIFNSLVFCVLFVGVKSKKSATVKSHQRFGALRIGTLRDHESVALLVCLDAKLRCNVAHNRKLLSRQTVLKKAPKQRLTGNSAERCRKLTFVREKITSLCSPELDYLFAFNHLSGNPLALFPRENERGFIPMEKIILPPQESSKKSAQVPFLSGEMVPVSGIWRPDHTRCLNSGDIWLRKQTLFPPCPGCSSSAGFALIEEVLHISEDPDFQ